MTETNDEKLDFLVAKIKDLNTKLGFEESQEDGF